MISLRANDLPFEPLEHLKLITLVPDRVGVVHIGGKANDHHNKSFASECKELDRTLDIDRKGFKWS
jgi:hypothetical protein